MKIKIIYLFFGLSFLNVQCMDSAAKLAKLESEINELATKESSRETDDKLKTTIIEFLSAGGDIEKKINDKSTVGDILRERKLTIVN